MHRPILIVYNNVYSTQTVGAYEYIAYQCTRSYVCMDVFILCVDHRITLD